MKKTHIGILCALTMVLVCTTILANRTLASKSAISNTIKGDGFVVLELFTSEGCSSCPEADELLAKVEREAGDKPVYVLAYHVDYWDHQGWRDVFSSPAYSERQYQYANKFGSRVYTPQVVVNGKTEFVGSNSVALDFALNSGLKGNSVSSIQLHGKQQGKKLNLRYKVTSASEEDELLIAIVQKKAVHEIKRGENEGRTLSHVQIVRSLQAFQLGRAENGALAVDLPKDYRTEGWEVIGLLQGKKTKAIHGATKAEITTNVHLN